MDNVLGLARAGLIFTRIQEGTQPGGLTPPGQTEQGIKQNRVFHTMCHHAGFRGGGDLRGGNSLAARERVAAVRERAALFRGLYSAGLFCVFPFSVSFLLLFPLFTVLLNCPYPDPPISACFFPFSSALWRRERWPRGLFVAGGCRNQNRWFEALPINCFLCTSFYNKYPHILSNHCNCK